MIKMGGIDLTKWAQMFKVKDFEVDFVLFF